MLSLSCFSAHLAASECSSSDQSQTNKASDYKTQTPIKHLVVIFAENCSFDHYFATYPHATNAPGEPPFKFKKNTPTINGLQNSLLTANENKVNPFRLGRDQAATCNPSHSYTSIQKCAHAGLMDKFVENDATCGNIVMGYYDGNTVTALWNYAQRFAMSDNFHSTTFSPSSPGAINLISGQTHGTIPGNLVVGSRIYTIQGTLIDDADPFYDDCSKNPKVEMRLTNVGDLLNKKEISWGWFHGGFADCSATHIGSDGKPIADYIPHHEPFQYYKSTSNPKHLPPTSVKMIGYQDQANHQYDLIDFWKAAKINNIPAVSFLKPPAYQEGHPGYSDPLALQTFLVETINKLQKLPEWESMAIFLAWDDSGGWYDHEMPPIINQSNTAADALVSPGNAGQAKPGSPQARLAYGMRMPFLIVSPFAKQNYVGHKLTDQTSILRFIEDNWGLGRIGNQSFDEVAGSLRHLFNFKNPNSKPLILNADTGNSKKNKLRFKKR
ncbi:MAG: alkaline phosphatase family protein [Parachlamydiaceae bacterium]|nr:alkaline phosphatase family protein [Parachlamydiaceae bacterium]